jgi:glycosyltransferase involved in cell wall biosynthesis
MKNEFKKKIIKKKILCFVNYYLPGFRSGGPVRTISNIVDQLGDEFEFMIVCSNHDAGETKLYQNIVEDSWQNIGKAKVYYASKKTINFRGITKLLNETKYDILYLNSFFNYNFSILPLLVIWFKIRHKKPCIIAPRGEFSPGAMKINYLKKKYYLCLVKIMGLYQNLNWQASSGYEKNDIINVMGRIVKYIYIAPNIVKTKISDNKKKIKLRKPGPLRLIFLSRISPKKNLKFFLKVLLKIDAKIKFTIYGPKEDSAYWDQCLNLIDKLPSNINIKIKKEVSNEQIYNIFKKYDLFVFPTLGENFGHVIFESLEASTPVLVSDQTPWKSNYKRGLQTLPLDEDKWINTIKKWSKFNDNDLTKKRNEAFEYILDYKISNNSLKKNKELFISVLNNKNNV